MRVYMADVHPIPSHGKRGALVATSLVYVSDPGSRSKNLQIAHRSLYFNTPKGTEQTLLKDREISQESMHAVWCLVNVCCLLGGKCTCARLNLCVRYQMRQAGTSRLT